MKIYHLLVFTTLICFLKGQQTARKNQSKFSKVFANISQECMKENGVTPERVMAVYAISSNDQPAKCYVACMLLRLNVTDGRGNYNNTALEMMITKGNVTEMSTRAKTATEKCEREDDENRCEKAIKFTRCMYSHKNEFGDRDKTAQNYQRRPMMPFGPGRLPRPWSKT